MPVIADPPVYGISVQAVYCRHKQKRRQDTGAGAHRTSHGSVYGSLHLARFICRDFHGAHDSLDQQPGRPYTDNRIDNLLQNLGYGGLHHTAVGLEVPP